MADGVTYAGALAACVARWGEPMWTCDGREPKSLPMARWGDDARGIFLTDCPGIAVELSVVAARESRSWTLAGEPTADAPLTALPAALDAADRWLRERNDPTKGP